MGQSQGQMMASASPGSLHTFAQEVRQIATLSYKDFLSTLQEINGIAASIAPLGGKRMVFTIKKNTDSSMFWKGTVRVKCHKVHCHSAQSESCRVLNLKQYIHVYNEIIKHSKVTDLQTLAENLQTSDIFNNLTCSMEPSSLKDYEECCICMDHKAEIILLCSHAYCEKCIKHWNCNSNTCPICRAVVDNPGDSWVLTDKPDNSEIAQETTNYLLSLTDVSGSREKP